MQKKNQKRIKNAVLIFIFFFLRYKRYKSSIKDKKNNRFVSLIIFFYTLKTNEKKEQN